MAPAIGYVTVVEANLLAALAHRELGDQRAATKATESAVLPAAVLPRSGARAKQGDTGTRGLPVSACPGRELVGGTRVPRAKRDVRRGFAQV
jgi:hypothetical protein